MANFRVAISCQIAPKLRIWARKRAKKCQFFYHPHFPPLQYPVLFRKESIGADKMEALKEVLGWVQDLIK